MNNDPFEVLAGLGASSFFIVLLIIVFLIVSYWKLFDKAGRPGWAAIIPIYNEIVLLQTAGLSPWFILIFLAAIVPIIGTLLLFIFAIYQSIKLAEAFGRGVLFGLGITFLPIIFIPILAFGDAEYQLGKKESEAI
jgi:hypothetical protein